MNCESRFEARLKLVVSRASVATYEMCKNCKDLCVFIGLIKNLMYLIRV